MHRTGFDEPALSPGPLVGSYPTVSPLPVATPEIRDQAVCFLCHFPSAFAASLARASCPSVSGLSSSPKGPRSPGLRDGLYRPLFARNPPVQAHPALRAADVRAFVEDELATDRALEGRPAKHCEELLLERPVERRDGAHSSRNTPTTLPRIWTCGA